jgi:hypothetical protein
MTVYVLTAILVTQSFFHGTKIDIETNVFTDAGRCLRNIEGNRAELEKKFDQVKMYCTPRELVKGK